MFELSSLFLCCFLLTVCNGQDIAQEIQRVQNIMNNPNSNSNPNSNNGNTGPTNMPSDAASIFAMDRNQDTDKNYYQRQGYGDREYEYKSGNGNGYNNYGFNNYNLNFDGGNNQSIIRPCYDLSCVRKYFAVHSRCKPVYGQVPEPLYRPQSTYIMPFFNLTVTSTGINYRGLRGGIIQDFYLDRQTDRAVLTLLFRNYRLNTTVDYYRYHRVGKEPAITKSFGATYFPALTTTTIFRGIDKLDLQTADSTGYVDGLPIAIIAPSAGVHPDPLVQRTYAALIGGLLIAAQESLLTECGWTVSTFIENTICDFGIRAL